jgi:anhydro-N-acetylmuramic acid kinase
MAENLTRAIGLMSGTSMDAIDVALVETDGAARISLGATAAYPYAEVERSLLRHALADAVGLDDRAARPGALAEAESMITRQHTRAVEAFLAEQAIDRASIDIVGFHGQTVLHRPERHLTVQIGDGSALAAALGFVVAYDFRSADCAAGGQGAPLVPIFHHALATAAGFAEPIATINIGGVANVSFLVPDRDPVACDAGPGNALIDDLMWTRSGVALDRDGAVAAKGRVDESILDHLLAHAYFSESPPKSLDRNTFSAEPVAHLSTEDAAATLTAFTAEGIARALSLMPERATLAIVCGGGARNHTLMRELANRLNCKVASAERFGWSVDAMEAQAFAFLAVRALKGLPITFPTTTGVARPLPGGLVVGRGRVLEPDPQR